METKDNTFLALDLLDNETINKLVLHIPHASTYIPLKGSFYESFIENEINKLTDWNTDDIFKIDATTIKAEFSRIFCDVERFSNDELEPMFKFGRGFFYTHTDSGEILRENNIKLKNKILNEYYIPHHKSLDIAVQDKLEKYNEAIIIDCHSYADIPFDSDLIKEENRPDICIGTDDFHTPQELTKYIVDSFTQLGYTTKLNNPYSGTMVNNESYLKDKRVSSIMIEINRKLYMDEFNVDIEKVNILNENIKKVLYSI